MKSLRNCVERLLSARPQRPSVDQMIKVLVTHINLATDAEVQAMVETFAREEDFAESGMPDELDLGRPGQRVNAPLSDSDVLIIGSLYDRLVRRAARRSQV